jgi:hypothetical protein
MQSQLSYDITMWILFFIFNIIVIYKIENETFKSFSIILLIASIIYGIFSLF